MMRLKWYITLFLLALLYSFSVKAGDFVKTNDGIIVRPDAPFSGRTKEVQLTVLSENIIRVNARADALQLQDKSLIIVGGYKKSVNWTASSSITEVYLKTGKLTAIVNLQTGAVTFRNAQGITN